jgi:phospholipid/cholesterol/gamma-HCH transport system substrate-binding protein
LKTSPAAATAVVRSPKPPTRLAIAENLDRRTDEISAGLARFSNSGLKEFEAFAVDGRRTLAELNKAIKNIDKHPTRLLFGR